MAYFDYRNHLKQQIRLYQEIETEQKKFIQLYTDHIELAKQHNCSQLLINARILLEQTLYIYNSVKADRQELQQHMDLLID